MPLVLRWLVQEENLQPPSFSVNETDNYFDVEYKWNCKGWRWEYEASIPKSTYEYFSGKARSPSYEEYVLNPYDDESRTPLILFASIVREMGYGVVLLELEQDSHMAAGVRISQNVVDNWQHDYPLSYYTTPKGKIYAYCETTGDGWELGHKPEELTSSTARVIDVF